MASPDWFKWGWYVTTIVETGSRWDVVESDFLIPQDRTYGGGVGIIQFTSENFELLRRIVKNGYSLSNFPSGTIKSNLESGVKTIEWFKSSRNGGLFDLAETMEIKNMLRSPEGMESQAYYNDRYFKVNNKAYYNNINKSNLDNECKAFLVNIIVLRPASVNSLINSNPSNLNDLVNKTLAIPQLSSYGSRMNQVANELRGKDFSKSPPIDIDNIANMSNPEPSPDPPEVVTPIEKEVIENDNNLIDTIKKAMTKDIYFYGNDNMIGNANLQINKVNNNMYKIKLSSVLQDIFSNLLNDSKNKLDEIIKDELEIFTPTNPIIPDDEPVGDIYFPVDITKRGVNFWVPPYEIDLKHNMDYGTRKNGSWHNGYDIGGDGVNHKVYAVRSGVVTKVGNATGGAGFIIQIKHNDDEYYSTYLHLVTNSNMVKVGNNVVGGQHIATMGNTGGSYKIHLHIVISTNDNQADKNSSINPRDYLQVYDNNKTKSKNPSEIVINVD